MAASANVREPAKYIGDCTTEACFNNNVKVNGEPLPASGQSLMFLAKDADGQFPKYGGGPVLALSSLYTPDDTRVFTLPLFPYTTTDNIPQVWATVAAIKNSTTSLTSDGQSNVVAGDMLVATGTTIFEPLHKSTTATRYLANTGTSNAPAWDTVNLANGVSGTLPAGNGGTGSTYTTFAGPTAARTFTLPDATTTLCGINTVCTGYQAGPLTGDVTTSGAAATIGSDKVLESMLKAVDTPNDEECLTYEATGGDFEWQSCGTSSGSSDSFTTITTSSGTSPVADSSTDTLTLTGTAPITVTGNSTTDTITLSLADISPDCSAGQFVSAIGADGVLTCAQPGNTTGNAATATALAADPNDCASNRYATAINASGTLTCGQVSLSAGVTGTLPVANGGNGAAPGADDQVLVSSSTSAGAWAAVPNCTDSGGNHLNYTASTNSFSCGTTSSTTSPVIEFDPLCDNTNVNTTTATTVLTLPTFNNTGKTTVVSGAIAINASSAGAARTYTVDVKLGANVKATYVGKTESATSKLSIPFYYVDNNCGSSCAFTVTVTSDATTGTQTVTECYASRVSY